MILLKRIQPFVVGIGLFVVLESLLVYRQVFWYLLALALLGVVAVMVYELRGAAPWRDGIFLTLVPSGLTATAIGLLLFVDQAVVAHTVIFATSFLAGWYTENVFHFYYQPKAYQAYALEHITAYANILTAWFGFSALYALRVFLSVSLFIVIPAFTLFIVLLLLQIARSTKVVLRDSLPILVTEAVVLLELSAAVLVLPTSLYVAGLLLVVPYYLMVNLTRHHLRGTLVRTVLVRYSLVSGLALAITFATAPWT